MSQMFECTLIIELDCLEGRLTGSRAVNLPCPPFAGLGIAGIDQYLGDPIAVIDSVAWYARSQQFIAWASWKSHMISGKMKVRAVKRYLGKEWHWAKIRPHLDKHQPA